MSLLSQLREERKRVHEAAERHLSMHSNNYDDNADRTFRSYTDQLEQIDARIAELSDLEARNAAAEPVRARFGSAATCRSDRGASGVERLLRGELRVLDVDLGVQKRDLSKLSAGAGNNTVPTSFSNTLQQYLIESSAIRQTNVTVFRTESGENLQVPQATAHSTGTLTAENVALTESDPTFGQVTLGSYKYGVRIDVTNELLNDSGIDLEGYLAEQAGRALGNASGIHMITGTGSGQPHGVSQIATVGVTGGTGVAGAFTADNLLDLFFSVIPEHRTRGYWLMNDATLAKVRKLKDADNNYIFVPNNSGAPDTLLGKPIVVDPNVADVGLSSRSVLFGNFATYGVRDVRSVRFEASSDFAFDRDVTVFRALLRTDGRQIGDSAGYKAFVGGAT